MPFEFRGDIAHADIAFNAWGETREELFQQAAQATMKVMVEDPAAIRATKRIEIELSQDNEEMLLFDFLNEIIFYKDAERLLLLPEQLSITDAGENRLLQATLRGEEIDTARHRCGTDVKAVTMLRFSVARVQQGWQATVVLDV